MRLSVWFWMGAASAGALLAAACASGGGGGIGPSASATPAPAPAPSPTPSPSPSPSPSPQAFDTEEYRRQASLAQINAAAAYEDGASGTGLVIAVIDTGVDIDHPDLAGNLHTASTDIVAGRGDLNGADSHGSAVAGVAAALRDGEGMHGVAFGAQILAIRADEAGSCAAGRCAFAVGDLVRAIDYAVQNGAHIINLSLGGAAAIDDPDGALHAALARAAAAGVIVVAAAGNQGDPHPQSPANFAGTQASGGLGLAVGSVDANGVRSVFSNGAAGVMDAFLMAPGENVLSTTQGGGYGRFSGTSFAAPHVAGALALLLEAFPHLKPAEAVSILIDSADDLGAHGVDAVYGAGLINIERAFAPQGVMKIVTQSDGSFEAAILYAPVSGPFGDWAQHSGAFNGMIARDAYDRPYTLSPGEAEPLSQGLARFESLADAQRSRQSTLRFAHGAIHLHAAPDPRAGGRADLIEEDRLAAATRFDLGPWSLETASGMTLTPALPVVRSSGLGPVAGAASAHEAFGEGDWMRLSRTEGGWRLAASAWRGDADDSAWTMSASRQSLQRRGVVGLEWGAGESGAAGSPGPLAAWLNPERKSRIAWAAMTAGRAMSQNWRWDARLEGARLDAPAAGEAAAFDPAFASAWSVRLTHEGGRGRLSLSLTQPLRAETGAARLVLPVEADGRYGHVFAVREAALTPSGREIDLEARYDFVLGDGGSLWIGGRFAHEPGHVAGAEPETSVWLGWRTAW